MSISVCSNLLSNTSNISPNNTSSISKPLPDYQTNYGMTFTENLVTVVKNTPDPTTAITNIEQGNQVISGFNQIVPFANNYFGTDIQYVNLDKNSINVIVKYAPVLGPWNDLRQAAFEFDPNNPERVDQFYLKLALFLGDTVFISSGAMELATKEGTSITTDFVKDTGIEQKIISMCKTDCTREFHKGMNSFINYASGQTLPLVNNLIGNIVNTIQHFTSNNN